MENLELSVSFKEIGFLFRIFLFCSKTAYTSTIDKFTVVTDWRTVIHVTDVNHSNLKKCMMTKQKCVTNEFSVGDLRLYKIIFLTLKFRGILTIF